MFALPLRHVRPATVFAGIAISGASYAFIRNIHADTGAPTKVFGRGPAMISLPLESSEQVNHNTKLLRFKLPNDNDISGLPLTSAVLTASWPKGRWFPVARPYTPVSASDTPGGLELLVKQYPDGAQSTHLHSLRPGETLFFAAALPGFAWKPNMVPRVTLIAGGSGITPIYQLARGILKNSQDATKVTLVYAANTDDDILLRKDFDAWEKQFPDRFNAVYAVGQPAAGSVARKGRVTKELLEEVVGERGAGGLVFVCGPPSMEAALKGGRWERGILGELGYAKDQVHSF